jgi:H+/Cl- antiporter ClcA
VIRYWVNDSGAGFGIQFRRTAKGTSDRKLIDAAIATLPSHFERHLNRQKDFLDSPIHLCGHAGSIFVGKWVGPEKVSALISQLIDIYSAVHPLLAT